MKKTAIEKAIEDLRERRADKMAEFDRADAYFVIQGRILAKCVEIDQAIQMLESLLPQERQDIEDAFGAARLTHSYEGNWIYDYNTASDYFHQTFKQPTNANSKDQ